MLYCVSICGHERERCVLTVDASAGFVALCCAGKSVPISIAPRPVEFDAFVMNRIIVVSQNRIDASTGTNDLW